MDRLRFIQQYLRNLNIFNTEKDDQHLRRNEIISTRIYLISLVIILSAFTLYITLLNQTSVVTFPTPSQSQYEQLALQFSDQLQCPCMHIAISYEDFITINPLYHEICSSDFVSQRWIDYLFYENTSYYYQLDFRRSASYHFQTIRTLCQQAQQTIKDSLTQFYSRHFITNQVISLKIFDIQINSSFNLLQITTPALFQNTLKLIRESFINNELFSAIDVLRDVEYGGLSIPRISMRTIIYYETQIKGKSFGCYCGSTVECKLPRGIFANLNQYVYAGSNWTGKVNATTNMINATVLIPGMYAGCSSIESLMQSTNECLFNQSCLNTIFSYIYYEMTPINLTTILNISRFQPETSLETIANELFLEDWNVSTSYEKYFNQCQPLFCQYTKQQKYNIIHIFTASVSLYGGLRLFLTFLIPIIVKYIRKKRSKENEDITSSSVSIIVRLRLLLRFIVNFIRKMNIYDAHLHNEEEQQMGMIYTRIYYIILIISLTVLTLYTSLKQQTKVISINDPTQAQFEQLQQQFPDSLQCPCSEISIKYDNFITFQPVYHQLCSSAFASGLWYQVDYWRSFQLESDNDFRYISPYLFTLLSTLCQSTKQTIIDSLTLFYSNEYVTSQVVSSDIFNNEVTSFIELFQIITPRSFTQTLNLIRRMTFGNQIASSRLTNMHAKIFSLKGHLEVHPTIHAFYNCSCNKDPTCKTPLVFGSFKTADGVVGMYLSCFLLDSVLLSTTECFYDNSCLNKIKSYMKSNHTLYKQLQVLNVSKITRYEHNVLIETIVNKLFIEDWNGTYSYGKYYNRCRPTYCSYSVNEKSNLIYILATVIGICGGLSQVIKFLAPVIVKVVRRMKRTVRNTEPSMTISKGEKVRQLVFFIKDKIINLNLFDRRSTDINVLRRQRVTTRLYIITLIITFIILILYTSLDEQSINVIIKTPTLTEYEKLQIKYPNTLNCPCDHVAVNYKSFIVLKPSYHNICSSDFVSQQWINYLHDLIPLSPPNLRVTASVQFHVLSLLCQSTRETVDDSLTQFYATKFINNYLISPDLFNTQIQSAIDVFKASAPLTFKRTLDMIRGLIQGNALLSAYETNWKFTIINTRRYASVYTNPRSYSNSCNCGTSSVCKQPAVVDNDMNSTLPGLFIGCYPVESILQSTLECLYQQTCVNLILSMIEEQTLNVTFNGLEPLVSSTNSYSINETIQKMVDRLFVNNWYINQTYEDYFKECHPSYCIYSYIERFDSVRIVATILGLYGGLTIMLKILASIVVRTTMHIRKVKRSSAIGASEHTVDSAL